MGQRRGAYILKTEWDNCVPMSLEELNRVEKDGFRTSFFEKVFIYLKYFHLVTLLHLDEFHLSPRSSNLIILNLIA